MYTVIEMNYTVQFLRQIIGCLFIVQNRISHRHRHNKELKKVGQNLVICFKQSEFTTFFTVHKNKFCIAAPGLNMLSQWDIFWPLTDDSLETSMHMRRRIDQLQNYIRKQEIIFAIFTAGVESSIYLLILYVY